MTQNNYWLVAEGNLEKKIKSLTEEYRTLSKLQNEIKKNERSLKVYKKCFFLRKLAKIFNLILYFSEFLSA